MKTRIKTALYGLMAAAFCLILSACAGPGGDKSPSASKTSAYLTFLNTEPALADPQRISEKYTVVLNVFDRLAEEKEEDGRNRMVPSLADSWEVSGDGLVYTFRLHPGVTFSNGAALTAEDVEFTFHRLISHPESRNRDLAMSILGAEALRKKTPAPCYRYRRLFRSLQSFACCQNRIRFCIRFTLRRR